VLGVGASDDAGRGEAEEGGADQRTDDPLAHVSLQTPEANSLRESEAQARHFQKLTPDTTNKSLEFHLSPQHRPHHIEGGRPVAVFQSKNRTTITSSRSDEFSWHSLVLWLRGHTSA